MPVCRDSFVMIILPGQHSYVIGGYITNGRISDTVYVLDRLANMWTQRASMPQSLVGHNAVALDTDTVLVCGGGNDSVVNSACYSYNETINAWTVSKPLNTARNGHGMTIYAGNAFLM
jgi:N-acetylneuraminic acid mutarotase